jgi:hypothetical protein
VDPTVLINQQVDVIAIFKKSGPNRDYCTPYKMRYLGRDIEFKELGLRHPTSAGKRMIHVFDVTDGSNDYRLEFDAEVLTWTLVALLEGVDNVQT